MSRYSDQTTYDLSGVQVPLPGVVVYVYDSNTGQLATLTADGGAALANPLTSDGNGNYYFNAPQGLYDLRYLVGGKTVLWKYGVAVGGYSLAYRAVAQDVVNTTVLNVTSATGQTVSTRGLLAGISSPVNGQRAYLAEPGREGWFQFSTANLSTSVTADPYQGLYVPPSTATTGASGAWVREVRNGEYFTSWWGPEALGNNAHLALNTIDGLLPATGCHVVFPPNTTYTVSSRTLFTKLGVVIRGAGYSSWLKMDPAASPSGALRHVLWVCGSNSKILNLRISGKEMGLFSDNPSCLIIQSQYGAGGPAGTIAQRTTTDIEIANCWLETSSVPLILGCSADGDGARNNGQVIVPSSNVRVHHCSITTNQHGVEVFCSDNAKLHDNSIFASPNTPAAQFSCAFRILGSVEVAVHDNHIQGLGQDGASRAIFRMSAADPLGVTGSRRSNQNVRIRNNDCNNTWTLFQIDECRGDLICEGNTWADPISSTVQTVAYSFGAGGIANGLNQVVDRFYSLNNRYTGVGYYMQVNGMLTKYVECFDDLVIGNSAPIIGPGRMYLSPFSSIKYTLFDTVRFIMSDGGGTGFQFKNAAGCILKVVRCTLPEQASGTGMFDSDATGTIIKTLGNSGEDATFGANSKHATGSFAAVS